MRYYWQRQLWCNVSYRFNFTHLRLFVYVLGGIERRFTGLAGVRTFATTVTLTNVVPIETVSRMLAHTKITTTQIYAKVFESKVSKDINQLQEKLSERGN